LSSGRPSDHLGSNGIQLAAQLAAQPPPPGAPNPEARPAHQLAFVRVAWCPWVGRRRSWLGLGLAWTTQADSPTGGLGGGIPRLGVHREPVLSGSPDHPLPISQVKRYPCVSKDSPKRLTPPDGPCVFQEGTAIRDYESRSKTPMRCESLGGLLLIGPAPKQAGLFLPRGFAGFNSEQQNVFYTACLRPESCKLPLPALPCRPSFAALSRSCLKELVICDELLRSKAGDSGGPVRLESHHEYPRVLISPIAQPYLSNQPLIIYITLPVCRNR
jgi:hypothetical protein